MTSTIAATHTRQDGLVEIDGIPYYSVSGLDRISPFLMSLVSDGDRWMFVSSRGGLTAGRGSARQALFPYVTDDRLHAAGGMTGPVTRLRVAVDGVETLWRPFDQHPDPGVRRSLAKSVVGDAVVFEEQHPELGLRFAYRWSSAEEFGFVRSVSVRNDGHGVARVAVLDGVVDLLPYGLEPELYQRLSNLSNAYKRSELVDRRLAVYSLESPVSDQAEPEEVLRATVAWSIGLDGPVSLDAGAVGDFEAGRSVPSPLVTGAPGAHLVHAEFDLDPGEERTWYIVADVAQDQSDVVRLRHLLGSETDLVAALRDATRRTHDRLVQIMAPADALQVTGDDVAAAHHFANVTYNVMRGGVPLDGYVIDGTDFADFVRQRNRTVADRHAELLGSLPTRIERRDLLDRLAVTAEESGDVHLGRLGDEYLPFSFSRRHGDPSRPWNKFSISVADEAGRPVIRYEGNWRDVFQNWEALCASFPEYLPGVVTAFVDASTADGHNPYRITREGIDWEVPDPDDPWGNIGYWGDHQVVYLLRLLEATDRYLPGEIGRRLGVRAFTSADVPYRIAPYDEMLRDPKATIEFDAAADARAEHRAAHLGGDGKLLVDADGEIVVVTLLEKLLVTALAKLANFVPGGGIWMNTQRPEWNDANNALVGHGLSMVTLFHLRRFLAHLANLVSEHGVETSISSEVLAWFESTSEVLRSAPPAPADDADRGRRQVMDRLGRAASDHRSTIYAGGLSGRVGSIPHTAIVELCEAALAHLDETIRENWRDDGLVHSYNLVHFPDDGTATVARLPEMLEGQVAALSSGVLTGVDAADLLDALFASGLYREDQHSFLLAPVRHLPGFVDKNVIDATSVDDNPLLSALVSADDRSMVQLDADGAVRFAADLTTEAALVDVLDELALIPRWAPLVERHRQATLDTYESVFGHRSYVGRSGSMYAYEGIGSIYWHMVTKLLLATEEVTVDAARAGADDATVQRLVALYDRVRAGLGFNKSAEEFGAIPIDPYSHTPTGAGAQQPGMTGAVKEEILARPRELGVDVLDGEIVFDSLLLRAEELLEEGRRWSVALPDGSQVVIEVAAGSLGLTVCQVPIIVTTTGDEPSVEVDFADGRTVRRGGRGLGPEISRSIFGRTGEVTQVRAAVRVP